MAHYDLTAFADFTWTADLSDHGSHVLKHNERLRGVWDESADGFPSDSERAYSIAWHAGRCGLCKEDAAWLLSEFYTRPGKKKLHRSKLEKTLRAWAKGREEASADDPGVQTIVEPGPDVEPPPDQEELGPKADGTGGADQRTAGTTGKKSATDPVEPYQMLPGPAFMRATFSGAVRLVPTLGLTACGAGLLTGAGGDGKSVLGLNLALAWTGETLPLGPAIPATRPLRVMLFQVEDTPGIIQERLTMIGVPVPESLILFTRNEPIRFSGARGKPNVTALARLGKTLAQHAPVDLVMFDPLIYLHEAEENSSSEMMRWLVPFREVCRQAGSAPLVIHHAGWAADGDDARGRGSTAIRAWSDFELALRAQTKNGRTLHRVNLVKANFAPRWKEPLTLEFNEKTLLFTPVDETETLCSTDALVAWMLADLNGVWTERRLDFYAAVCKQFGCSDKTARQAVATAIREGKLKDHGQRKPLKVVTSQEETLL